MKKEDKVYCLIGKATCIAGLALVYVVPMLVAIYK